LIDPRHGHALNPLCAGRAAGFLCTRPTTAAAASAARWIFEGVASEKKDRSPQMPGQLRRTAEITWRTADYFCQVRFL